MSSHVVNCVDRSEAYQLPPAQIAKLVERASQLFTGEVNVEDSVDPECPTAVYVVVRVLLNGPRPSTDEIIDREPRWHREAAQIAPEAKGIVRLLVE